MMNPAIYELFNDIVSGPEENINLAEAALLIAGNEYARLDIPYYLGFIDQLAETLDKRINHESGNREIIDIANNFLFEEIGFSGNFKQFNDPKNSFLNDV
nr:hypothetical protein [Candidatus Aminicenantes bacterium]